MYKIFINNILSLKKSTFFFSSAACCLLFVAILLTSAQIHAQTKAVSFAEVLEMSKNSLLAQVAKHEFLSSYWDYESIKANRAPSIALTGTLPSFTNSISKITQPDGTDLFTKQTFADYTAGFEISQNIPLTGGQIFVSTNLERLDVFGNDSYTSYMSTPVSVGIYQTLFGYNSMKWEQQINPVKYQAAKQKYLENCEKVVLETIERYFTLLSAQKRLENAFSNKNYTDTIYYIAGERYKMGSITEAEYLQIELSALQSALQVENEKNNRMHALLQLKNFLQINDHDLWELETPGQIHVFDIPTDQALSQASENNPVYTEFMQKELESQSRLAQAKADNGFKIDLYAAFGLTQNANEFSNAYKNPMDKELFSMGVKIPITDFGKSKGRKKVAELQLNITQTIITQEKQHFEQALLLKLYTFQTQSSQVNISQKSVAVGEKRFYAEKESYQTGKTDFTYLHNAIKDKDQTTVTYIETLKSYWQLYYEIRQYTLYDFQEQRKIEIDFDKLIKK